MSDAAAPSTVAAPSIVDVAVADDMAKSKSSSSALTHSSSTMPSKMHPRDVTSETEWSPESLYKDAAWFATNCALPDKGETPHKISDITDDMLTSCFGEKTRNGYRLNSYTGIPTEEILALSCVIDGYDKPVNGVLSHTFAKGAYADRILKRKVNWAAYAATKLKGQLQQHHRDGKPKPDGPPWIRKPVLYVPPRVTFRGNNMASPVLEKKPHVLALEYKPASGSSHIHNPTATGNVAIPPSQPNAGSPPQSPWDPPGGSYCEGSNSNELLTVMGKQAEKMKARHGKITSDLAKVESTIARLKQQELGQTTAEIALTAEMNRLEIEMLDLQQRIQNEEDAVEETTTDIELETNKETDGNDPDEVNVQVLDLMQQRLAAHEQAILNWTSLLQSAKTTLQSTKEELDRKRKRHATVPKTLDQLNSLSAALEFERVKIESYMNDQIAEESIVGRVLSKPCVPLSPTYVLTSTSTYLTHVTISNCPLCCNGYHCNNWVPASCGHTYHPVCLFTHLTSVKSSLKCLACGKALTPDWLRSWGLDTTWRENEELEKYQLLVGENEDIYGKDCNLLPRRRQWVKNIEKVPTEDDHDNIGAVSGVISRVPSSVNEEDDLTIIEAVSSKPDLLIPKIEGESGKKRRSPVKRPHKRKSVF